MKTYSKIFAISVLGVILFSLVGAISSVSAVGTQNDIGENQFQRQVAANETQQFRIRNRFQFQIRTNSSTDVDFECDVDNVGDRSFGLELNTTENQQLTIRINSSDETLGLGNGAKVQARNQNRYEYRNQFMLNISLNGTDGVRARLSVDCDEEGSTWAYLDEETEEFVTVESTIEDGELVAVVDHFSVWTVLSPETEDATIDGYALGLLIPVMGIAALALIRKARK